jgi:hypothetical protein
MFKKNLSLALEFHNLQGSFAKFHSQLYSQIIDGRSCEPILQLEYAGIILKR